MIDKNEINFSKFTEMLTAASAYVETGELKNKSLSSIILKLTKSFSELSAPLQNKNKEQFIEMQKLIFQRSVKDYNSEFCLAEKLIAFHSFIENPFSKYSKEIQDNYRTEYECLLARANEYWAVKQSALYQYNSSQAVPVTFQEIDHNMTLLNKLGNLELKQAALTDHILWRALLQCNKELTQEEAKKLLEKCKEFLKTIGLDKEIKFDPSNDTHSMDSINFEIRTERSKFKTSIESYQEKLNTILSNKENSLDNSISSSPNHFFHFKTSVGKANETNHQSNCTLQ